MATYRTTEAVFPIQDAVSFLDEASPVNTDFRGAATYATNGANGFECGVIGAPCNFFRGLPVDPGSTGDTYRVNPSLINFVEIMSSSILVGKEVRTYRISNGVMSLIRTSTILSAHLAEMAPPAVNVEDPSDDNKLKAVKIYDSTTIEFLVPGSHKRPTPITYAVAAVDANGNYGPLSSYVEVTNEASPTTGSAVNVTTFRALKDQTASLAAPTGVAGVAKTGATQVHQITFNAVSGATGYALFYTPNPIAEATEDPRIVLSADPANPVTPDDFIILSGLVLEQSEADSNPWNWLHPFSDEFMPLVCSNPLGNIATKAKPKWLAHSGAKPDVNLPDHHIRYTATAGQKVEMLDFFASGTWEPFYEHMQPNEIWRIEFWAKADAATTYDITFNIPNVANQTVNVGTTWTKHVVDFSSSTGAPEGRTAYQWQISHTPAGAHTFDITGLRVYNTTRPYGHVVSEVAPETDFRCHSLIKIFHTAPVMDDILGISGNTFRGETLQTQFEQCELHNVTPHIQIEPTHTEAEWLDMIAYIAAPVSSGHPMALRRQAQGHPEPYSTTFDRIIFEFGNEAWNFTAGFFTMPAIRDNATQVALDQGTSWGAYCEMMSQWIKGSPYWANVSAKWHWFGGAWARQPAFAESLLRSWTSLRDQNGLLGIAAYTSGWDVNSNILEDTVDVAQNLLAVVANHGYQQRNHKAAIDTVIADIGGFTRPSCYEAGPGYQINGLNGAVVTPQSALGEGRLQSSRYAANANMDSFLYMASLGFAASNFFTIGPGAGYIAKARPGEGGQHFTPYAAWLDLVNEMGHMEVFSAEFFRNGVITGLDENEDAFEIDAAGMYAIRSKTTPGRYALVAINRRVNKADFPVDDPGYDASDTGVQSMVFSTNFAQFSECRQYSLEGNCRAYNRHRIGQRLDISDTGVYSYVADPLSVDTSMVVTDITNSIADPTRVSVDNLNGGNMRFLVFDDVVLAGEVVTPPTPSIPAGAQAVADAGGDLYDLNVASTVFSDLAGTVAAALDGPVGHVAPLSGSDRALTAAADADRPVLREVAGQRYLSFEAATAAMSNAPLATANATYWIVTPAGIQFSTDKRFSGASREIEAVQVIGWGWAPGPLSAALRTAVVDHYGLTDLGDWDLFMVVTGGANVDFATLTDVAGYTIDWGDGTVQDFGRTTASQSHTHTAGEYLVKVRAVNNMQTVTIFNGNYAGDLSNFPQTITQKTIVGPVRLGGDASNLSRAMVDLYLAGANKLTGETSGFPSTMNRLRLSGPHSINPSSTHWGADPMKYCRIDGGLSSAQVDQLLISLATVTNWEAPTLVQSFSGGFGQRTAASDAAVTTLQGNGVTVTTT